MAIVICILKTVAAYIALMLIGTNLLGLSVRGLFDYRTQYDKDSVAGRMAAEDNRAGKFVAIFFGIVSITYFFALSHFWNWGVALVAAILMLSRLPDLLWEIKNGQKITRKNMPKTPLAFFCSALSWAALPILWYFLCYFPKN